MWKFHKKIEEDIFYHSVILDNNLLLAFAKNAQNEK